MLNGRYWRPVLFILFVAAPRIAAYAEQLPVFFLWRATWDASDIVVVGRDGLVHDVWKGGLEPGDTVPILDLKLTESAAVHYGPRHHADRVAKLRPADAVLEVSGRRRTLFLKRNAQGRFEPALGRGADRVGFDISTVWIEADQCFAIQQLSNSEALLHPLRNDLQNWWRGLSEKQLKSDVLKTCDTQSRLEATHQIEDLAERAKVLVTFLDEHRMVRYRVTKRIVACGKPAWPVIRPLLLNDEHLASHAEVISLAFRVDGDAAIPDLERIVQQEAEYWRTLDLDRKGAVDLKPPASYHFARLKSALWSLKRAEYTDRTGIVASLRRDWNASSVLRQLGAGNDKRSPVLKHADAIVGEVDDEFAKERLQAIKQMADRAIKEISTGKDTGVFSIAESIAVLRQSDPAIPGFKEEKLKQLRRIRNALQEATGRNYGPVFDFLERLVNERAD